jgi:signal transduction histidine kinase
MNNFDNKDDQFRENFIMALAHKLRTPLNGARWTLETVMEDAKGEQKKLLKEGYDKIIESINIIGQILKSTTYESYENFAESAKEKVNLCNVVDGIIKNLNFLIKEKNITLDYKNCDSATVYGDEKMLDIALTNFFDNAFRYSPGGKVSVSITKSPQIVTLLIKDSGIGISKEDMTHLYEKFFRGKNARDLDPDESGIGLYMTKRIVEMHKGSIKIDSELNHGTTVEVVFPLD